MQPTDNVWLFLDNTVGRRWWRRRGWWRRIHFVCFLNFNNRMISDRLELWFFGGNGNNNGVNESLNWNFLCKFLTTKLSTAFESGKLNSLKIDRSIGDVFIASGTITTITLELLQVQQQINSLLRMMAMTKKICKRFKKCFQIFILAHHNKPVKLWNSCLLQWYL